MTTPAERARAEILLMRIRYSSLHESQVEMIADAIAQAVQEENERWRENQVLGDWPPSASQDAILLARAELEAEGWLSPQRVEQGWPGLKTWAEKRTVKFQDRVSVLEAEVKRLAQAVQEERERIKKSGRYIMDDPEGYYLIPASVFRRAPAGAAGQEGER